MVRTTKKDGEVEPRRLNPNSSKGIYVTASVEADVHMRAQNRNIQEEEKKISPKVNEFKNMLMLPSVQANLQNSFQQQPTYPETLGLQRNPDTPFLNSSSPYTPTPPRKLFIILEGRSASFPTKINGRLRQRLCGSEDKPCGKRCMIFEKI